MKKINARFNSKSRVICHSDKETGHTFFYSPFESKECYFLFSVNEYSKSIASFFRDKGIWVNGDSYAITIGELYNFDRYYNKVLAKLICIRIPQNVEYVIKYCSDKPENKEHSKSISCSADKNEERYSIDFEIAS